MIHLPIPRDRPIIVFTDLDGTLIDYATYESLESRAALKKLHARSIPLIFCSSKTFAEQKYLQDQLGIIQPFIFENGSAVAIPSDFFTSKIYNIWYRENDYDIVVFAHAGALALRSFLAHIEGVKGYADASDAEIKAATGLCGSAITRARERWFTETLLEPVNAIQAAKVEVLLKPAGFSLSLGGRFYTAQSARVHKGKAVKWMINLFRKRMPESFIAAAVGDSRNDLPMFEAVDLPFLVMRPDYTWVDVHCPQLVKIKAVGPAGFSTAIQMLLEV